MSSHGLFHEAAAERGILGFLAFVVLLGAVATSIVRARRHLLAIDRAEAAGLVLAFGLALLAHLASMIFLSDAYPRNLWMMITLCLSMSAIARHPEPGRIRRRRSRHRR